MNYEYTIVWRRKVSASTVIFLLNRYVMLITAVVVVSHPPLVLVRVQDITVERALIMTDTCSIHG